MEKRWYDGRDPKISDIKVHIEGGKVSLKFNWPNELEMLYIYKANLANGEEIDLDKPYRKYTKNEYSNFGGFIDDAADGGIVKYVLCPYRHDGFEEYLVTFENKENEVCVIASRIEVRYELHEKKKLFGKQKKVQMQVFCEKEIPKEYLCYVKKKGSIPVGLADGMRFQFIDDFSAGNNLLPEVEIDKDEYIRIYLTEEVPYQEAYRVIKG